MREIKCVGAFFSLCVSRFPIPFFGGCRRNRTFFAFSLSPRESKSPRSRSRVYVLGFDKKQRFDSDYVFTIYGFMFLHIFIKIRQMYIFDFFCTSTVANPGQESRKYTHRQSIKQPKKLSNHPRAATEEEDGKRRARRGKVSFTASIYGKRQSHRGKKPYHQQHCTGGGLFLRRRRVQKKKTGVDGPTFLGPAVANILKGPFPPPSLLH